MKINLSAKHGFTLMESLLVVAMIAIIASGSGLLYYNYQTRNELHIAAQDVAQIAHTAQLNSQEGIYDTNWGLHIAQGEITAFAGDSYATRNADLDIKISLSGSINVSPTTEIIFTAPTGLPSDEATITLSSRNQSKTITINTLGVVDY